ncbi:hypothetical protein BS78_03G136000 [Paspalum vaginatum]|nr:hypothetical protein BS78_03G136000 [Paspalum vaginatum]
MPIDPCWAAAWMFQVRKRRPCGMVVGRIKDPSHPQSKSTRLCASIDILLKSAFSNNSCPAVRLALIFGAIPYGSLIDLVSLKCFIFFCASNILVNSQFCLLFEIRSFFFFCK